MNNDTFQWSDQKAKEFAQFCQGRVIVFVEEELEKFKQSKMPKKERIKVDWIQDLTYNSAQHNTLIVTTAKINPEKYEAIKSAIERVLNDDGMKCREDVPDEEKMYSRDYFLKEVEKAFNAARERVRTFPSFQKYDTFQDYVNSKKVD